MSMKMFLRFETTSSTSITSIHWYIELVYFNGRQDRGQTRTVPPNYAPLEICLCVLNGLEQQAILIIHFKGYSSC